ncbi:hypothetical protein M885DRAFT_530711 [Pelagophyceae sp. CCMP2097]|nr:hypothetical protein M885DRAFT_530711 [Pelagophyceae sp. CCMP2097]
MNEGVPDAYRDTPFEKRHDVRAPRQRQAQSDDAGTEEHSADEGASDALDFIADQPKRHRLERSDAVERRAVRALFDDGAAEMHDGAADESDGGDAAAMGGPSDGPRDDGATEQQRPCVLRNMQCLCSERRPPQIHGSRRPDDAGEGVVALRRQR